LAWPTGRRERFRQENVARGLNVPAASQAAFGRERAARLAGGGSTARSVIAIDGD
jgi:hypothetical protein